MTSSTFDILGRDDKSVKQRVELTVVREFGLLAGRILGIAAFIALVSWRTEQWAIVGFLAVTGSVPMIGALFMQRLVKQAVKQ